MSENFKYKIIFEKLEEEKSKQVNDFSSNYEEIYEMNEEVKNLKEIIESFEENEPLTYSRS